MSRKESKAQPAQPIRDRRGYNMKEAAAYLGATPGGVRTMLRQGELPYYKCGRRFLIDINDLDRFIDGSKIGVAA